MKAQKKNSTNERQDLTTTIRSEMEDGAKIEISIEDAKQNLQELQKEFAGITSPRGFIGAVSKAFGYPDGVHQQSFYFEITAPDGTPFTFRISNHNVNSNYADQREISVTVKSRRRENGFRGESEEDVREYVYFKESIQENGDILSSIAGDLIKMLETGYYEDSSGVAVPNRSKRAIARDSMTESGRKLRHAIGREVDNWNRRRSPGEGR